MPLEEEITLPNWEKSCRGLLPWMAGYAACNMKAFSLGPITRDAICHILTLSPITMMLTPTNLNETNLLGEASKAKTPLGKLSSEAVMAMEHQYGAHNYHPLPIVFSAAEGIYVWDPEGRKYMDFLSAYSAVNQGHAHPKIIKALTDQAGRLALSSRAFYNDVFGSYAKFITEVMKSESN
jgi:hypothetical protein